MKRRRGPQIPAEFEPSPGEFAAAGMLGFSLVLLTFYLVRWRTSGSVDVAGMLVFAALSGAFVWIGGRGLRRIRTWTVAAKVFGGIGFLIGLTTAITGYHSEGQGKIWRKVDRDADMHLIVGGLLLLGCAFLIEAWWRKKGKRAEQGSRSNAGSAPHNPGSSSKD